MSPKSRPNSKQISKVVSAHSTRVEDMAAMKDETIGLIQLLLARLERISADSYYAHRASGVRGALIRMLDQPKPDEQFDQQTLARLVELGFEILELAATDINR